MEIGYLTALLGGALALLSPCGALLLPAFFAGTVGAGPRLLLHGGVFYLGLSVTLVPLGVGAGLLGTALTAQRELLVTVAGLLIVVLGILVALGIGFDTQRLLPGADRWRAAAGRRSGLPRTFVLGTLSGVAGFCAGPILGAVLTLAATSDSVVVGGTMLAVYGAGMVVPLLAVAWGWTRLGPAGRSRLRGREVVLGRVRTHTTSLVTGALLVVVGIVFALTNGMAALPDLVPVRTQARLQEWALAAGGAVPDVALVLGGAAVALALWIAWT
ncbi:MAG: cytochrome c biogenesis protein CcdA, partial [Actinotalea sp.]|nr:cytochrome c biogenesis protein CcdA [Actinotalea sp.]